MVATAVSSSTGDSVVVFSFGVGFPPKAAAVPIGAWRSVDDVSCLFCDTFLGFGTRREVTGFLFGSDGNSVIFSMAGAGAGLRYRDGGFLAAFFFFLSFG